MRNDDVDDEESSSSSCSQLRDLPFRHSFPDCSLFSSSFLFVPPSSSLLVSSFVSEGKRNQEPRNQLLRLLLFFLALSFWHFIRMPKSRLQVRRRGVKDTHTDVYVSIIYCHVKCTRSTRIFTRFSRQLKRILKPECVH